MAADEATRRLVLFALACRVVVLIVAGVGFHWAGTYDSSVPLETLPPPTTHLERLVHIVVAPFVRWDAVWFLRIAQFGYEFEHAYAFFPGLPLAIRVLATPMSVVESLTAPYARALSGFLLCNTCAILATVALYRLGLCVLDDRKHAFRAALLFSMNPAGIFFSAVYTEAPYALAVFVGLAFLAKKNSVVATMCFIAAASLRGNGSLYALFLVYDAVYDAITYRRWLGTLCKGAVLAVCVCLPSFLFQMHAFRSFCLEDSREIQPINDPSSIPWCQAFPPSVYAYVQRHYWNVGFLLYYEWKQLPNFLLAFPSIVLSSTCVITSLRRGPSLGSRHPSLLPHVLHLAFLTALGVFAMNIQVTTRFLSACPLLYWWCAANSSKGKIPWRMIWFTNHSILFNTLGPLLFAMFLPWT